MPTSSFFFLSLAAAVSLFAGRAAAWEYPKARAADQADDYFGVTVADPYRWLEDDRSDETAAWVRAENALTAAYLDRIPFREEIRRIRLSEGISLLSNTALPIAAIAERCGGEIGLTSEGEGHGSTFWLWIPCEKIEQ